MTDDDIPTPDRILAAAGLSVLGDGHMTLRLDCERNLWGGQPLLRLLAFDPAAPRRKPVNLLRQAGIADVIVGSDKQGLPELLEMVAESLRRANGGVA